MKKTEKTHVLQPNTVNVTRKRILAVCVKLFLEQGYTKTTVSQIVKGAGVSNSSFQNIFRAKDGVLTELVEFMFGNQFGIARQITGEKLPPVYVYAVETVIQLTLTELNENLREIYLEAYAHEEALEYILHATSKELYQIFGPYQPKLGRDDFYVLDIGTSGIMRGYMARRCDETLTLERKIESFLAMAFAIYKVPEAEQQEVLEFLRGIDIREVSTGVLEQLFRTLAMHYEFSL